MAVRPLTDDTQGRKPGLNPPLTHNTVMLMFRIIVLAALAVAFTPIAAPTHGGIPVPGEIYTVDVPVFDPALLNHSFPETRDNDPVYTPITYAPYFKAERALFDYYPRFQPGYVSFSPQGNAWLQYGSYIIQTCDPGGQWTYVDLMPFIEDYAVNTLGFSTFHVNNLGQANEAAVRFANDGDAYVFCAIEGDGSAAKRTGLLLHSRDDLQTWTTYQLPYYLGRFEKRDGHNTDCLNRPPVILMSLHHTKTSNYITIPEKQPDGTLVIPTPVLISHDAIPFIPHSGDGNNAITHADEVFVVYGKAEAAPGYTVEDGCPAYAVTYDIPTRQLTAPVLVGFGGDDATDIHNWPAITLDGNGILHVIINGHTAPFRYVHSTQPYSTATWSSSVDVSARTSYGSLNCDSNNTLYVLTRSQSPYSFPQLTCNRKKAGQDWEIDNHLVIPFKQYYKSWYHKVALDPGTGRLFVSYYAQNAWEQLFLDEYLCYLAIWSDREKDMLTQSGGALPAGTAVTTNPPGTYLNYGTPASEMCTLVTDDGGDNWRLAVTDDFAASEPPASRIGHQTSQYFRIGELRQNDSIGTADERR